MNIEFKQYIPITPRVRWYQKLGFLLFFQVFYSMCALASPDKVQEDSVIRVPKSIIADDPREGFSLGVLKLAFANNPELAKYRFIENANMVSDARRIRYLQAGELDVLWTGFDPERLPSELFARVRIPIFKGLLGYRLLMIREGDQHKFDHIGDIEGLCQLQGGFGEGWPDLEILNHNELNTITIRSYELLFNMLEYERFDYVLRSVYEVWKELDVFAKHNLVAEQNLLIRYALANYFYVAKEDEELARKIERGFLNAIENGSFDAYFYSHPTIKETLEKTHFDQRKMIQLQSPRPAVNDLYDWDLRDIVNNMQRAEVE